MGRPKIKLTDEHIRTIEHLAGLGLTQVQVAECLPIAARTLRDRLADPEDTEVSAAYARGQAKDAEELSQRHRDIAMGKRPNTLTSDQRKAIEWRLERQHKWAGKQEIDHTGIPPIVIRREE